MLTWLLGGYVAVSMLTFIFIYATYVAAARADLVQEQGVTSSPVPQRPTKSVSLPVDTLSLSTI